MVTYPTDDDSNADSNADAYSDAHTDAFSDAPHPPHPPQQRPAARSFARRHPLGLGIAGAAIAVVLVSGLTAWGVGTAVVAANSSAVSPLAPGGAAAGKKAGTAARPLAGARVIAIRGTIQSISGATWTVATRAGAIATVTVDAATRYGTTKSPAAASDFVVGSPVVVLEKRPGATALRVTSPPAKPGQPTPSATPSATPGA